MSTTWRDLADQLTTRQVAALERLERSTAAHPPHVDVRAELLEAARDEAARLVGQAADALATIARIRPEIGSLLDDVGVTRDLRRALELLRADEVAA